MCCGRFSLRFPLKRNEKRNWLPGGGGGGGGGAGGGGGVVVVVVVVGGSINRIIHL